MDIKLLEKVSNTPGIPGDEERIQKLVMDELKGVCDEVSTDRLGNVIGLRKATTFTGEGNPFKVVLAAHADEIGMMVKHIDDKGFIRFEPVGGLVTENIISQCVVIHGRGQEVNGVIVPHYLRGDDKLPKQGELVIDVAMPKDEVCKLVEVGDCVSFAQEFKQLNDKVFMGRNFDDRMGTFCLLEAMKRVGDVEVDVYAVSTVQEEMGVRGVPTAAFAIQPDIGLAIDGSITRGPHNKPHEATCELGEGTGIYMMDRLTIGNRRLVRFLLDLCEENNIPHQRNIGGGTDASAIQRTGLGSWATTVGAPTRYMHSTVQLCHADDVEATIEMLRLFLENAHKLLKD